MKFFARIFFLLLVAGSCSLLAQTPTQPGAFLGVYLADVNESRASELKLTETRGALVGKVLENSPAAKAGLRENDVIVAFDAQPIQQSVNVFMLLNETLPGSSVLLKIIRNGREQDITVIMGDRQGTNLDSSLASANQFYSTPKRMRFGVKAAPLTDQLASYLGSSGKGGMMITEVEHRTLAERAGLKAGDCLLTINGEHFNSASEMTRLVNDAISKVTSPNLKNTKNELTFTIIRDRQEQTITAKLTDADN